MTLLQGGEAGLDHNVVFEIENPLQILQSHIKQQADAGRKRLQEPDVGDRRGEFNVAHPLAPNPRQSDFYATFFADNALIFHPLIFTAEALIILDRAKNARTKQSVTFRFERPVINCLGLFDFAKRPRQNLLRRGNRDFDTIKALWLHDRVEQVHDLLVHGGLLTFENEMTHLPQSSLQNTRRDGFVSGANDAIRVKFSSG